VLSELGSLPVAIALVVVSAGLLIWRRDIAGTLGLAVGLAMTYGAVHITKAALDRPRPPRSLVESDLSSFPSSHAAYAVTWIAVAVALGRVLPNVASRFAFLLVAVVIASVVGLSRVYLRANWLSDVTGGWGIAAAIYSVLGLAALVVAYVRHNARDAPRRPAPEPT